MLRIAASMRARRFKVWVDTEMMSGSTLDAMAAAVEDAYCVLICITERYKAPTPPRGLHLCAKEPLVSRTACNTYSAVVLLVGKCELPTGGHIRARAAQAVGAAHA